MTLKEVGMITKKHPRVNIFQRVSEFSREKKETYSGLVDYILSYLTDAAINLLELNYDSDILWLVSTSLY